MNVSHFLHIACIYVQLLIIAMMMIYLLYYIYVLYLLYLTYITLSTRALTIESASDAAPETASDAAPSLSLVEASALDGAKPM